MRQVLYYSTFRVHDRGVVCAIHDGRRAYLFAPHCLQELCTSTARGAVGPTRASACGAMCTLARGGASEAALLLLLPLLCAAGCASPSLAQGTQDWHTQTCNSLTRHFPHFQQPCVVGTLGWGRSSRVCHAQGCSMWCSRPSAGHLQAAH